MKDPLLSLPPCDLRALASAIASGRLSPPYSATSVQRCLGPGIANEIASSLQDFAALGVEAQALTRILGLLAAGMADRPPLEDLVDLVTTGPANGEEGGRDTSIVVRDLFHNAKNSVVVIGYAVHQGQKEFQALADQMMDCASLQVRMYLDIQRAAGDTSAPSELVRRFVDRFRCYQWPSGRPLPQVFYDPRSLELDYQNRAALHAKCIIVDGRILFVSSANFTEAAQQKNIEVGLLLESPVLADRLLRFFNLLVESSHLKRAM